MSKQGQRLYEFGPYRLLPAERLLLRDGEPVALTPKAFETLVALVERGGRLVEKDELLNEVWAGTSVEESNVAQNVFTLRRVLGKSEGGGPYIETVPKRGYRFLPLVKVSEDRGEQLPARAPAEPATRDLQAAADSVRASESEARPVTTDAPASAAEEGRAQPEARRGRKAGLIAVSAAALALVALGVVIARLFLVGPPAAPAGPIKLSRLMSGVRIPSAAVSPDGRYVAHVVENAEQTSIWVRQVSTTTDLHIIPPDRKAFYWGLTFSRDGDHLYYNKSVPGEPSSVLYRVPAPGGASRKLVTDINSHVTTSPDGRQIAFVRDLSGESALVIADADGTNERRLAVRHRPSDSFSGTPRGGPSWSPDGRTIATGVISLRGGYHGEVIGVSVADGTERALTPRRWERVAQVAWLSDGSGLLVAAREPSAGAQIWHVSYPEGAARKVTNDLNDYHGVSLTADSHTLITVQYDQPSAITFEPEKPPSASKRSTAGMNEGFYGMSWTTDGRVAYAAQVGGNLDVWLLEADGVTADQLTTDPRHDSTPSVSPDGRSIAFISYRDGDIPHVWRMDMDGSNQRRLTSQTSEGTPVYTPDGRWIVYSVAGSGIWKVPAEGGEPVAIYLGSAHTPSLSPDGSLIACFYWDEKVRAAGKIALLPIEGGPPVKVLDEPLDISSSVVRWTADGRALVYVATHNGVSNLRTLPLDGAPPRDLTEFTSDLIFNFAWSRDHKQLALARGNTAEHVVLVTNFR
ncbi:MAG: winged helix-turn-helix domain-containing protein [Acidobacteria bacterium]|nr:winged helix-turn-helix domain-containing protein [Acidobacteriota bacterium]MCA1643364.1 winged helix-turn-helix domain-containing protein [Acidobacteriota bacterium]